MPTKILVIDDEPNNRKFIAASLEDLDVDIIEASDGLEGWEILEKSYEGIDLILLDKMMPRMNGIELIKKLNGHSEMSKIPVIMQTAAGTSAEVKEGIDLGVYHYLIKPYNDEILISLVKSALLTKKEKSDLFHKLHEFEHMLELIEDCKFSFKSLSDAQRISTMIASFYPNPEDVVVGISELLINAVEHGNLNITYDEKTKLLANNAWHSEIENRLEKAEYKNKAVKAIYSRTADKICLTIEDEGNGFDWRKRLDLDSNALTQSHGRGIPMCKHLFFDDLEFNEKGNKVTATVYLKK
jgi:DNA-binding response OmpR family regulator